MKADTVRDTAGFCPGCGFTSRKTTARFAAHALRLHSCARHRDLATKHEHGARLRAQRGVTRDCHCPCAAHQHGTYAAYSADKCRCRPCATAATAYNRTRTRRSAYGTWQPYVDAEPARRHVLALRDRGVGWKRVADVAGISHGSMTKLLYGQHTRNMGPSARLRPDTARRLLDVTYEQAVAPNAMVDGTDTWQRVEGLVALGYSFAWIAHEIGQDGRALQLNRDRVLRRNADAVAVLADRIGDTPGPSSRARRYAAAHGWLTPMQQYAASLDNDDSGPAPTRAEILRENAQWLIDGGLSVELTAERLHVRVDYLRDVLAGKKGRRAS